MSTAADRAAQLALVARLRSAYRSCPMRRHRICSTMTASPHI